VLDTILQPEVYPELYGDIHHVVRINYYPPRGDNKEGWDNIDIFGWLGYPMQIKIDFLCRDSILAAPIVLDLALFLDLANRAGMSGIQEWLSFYWKSPAHPEGVYPEHDLFIQLMKLKNTLRLTDRWPTGSIRPRRSTTRSAASRASCSRTRCTACGSGRPRARTSTRCAPT
jgi:myo-inositol-1-phosphate synthase